MLRNIGVALAILAGFLMWGPVTDAEGVVVNAWGEYGLGAAAFVFGMIAFCVFIWFLWWLNTNPVLLTVVLVLAALILGVYHSDTIKSWFDDLGVERQEMLLRAIGAYLSAIFAVILVNFESIWNLVPADDEQAAPAVVGP